MPERVIVQYGVYLFDPEDLECFRLRVLTQIERKPEGAYENFKYQKPQSFYGYAQLMFGQWVVETKQLQYEQELLFEWTNDLGQLAILTYCAAQQNRNNLIALSGCIPGCALAPGEQPIPGLWKFPYDRIVFKLFANTTLLVNTDRQEFANPCEVPLVWGDEGYIPPESPGTNVPENPNDPGYDIPTPPYYEPDDDFGETYNPEEPEEPEPTVQCWVFDGWSIPPNQFIPPQRYITLRCGTAPTWGSRTVNDTAAVYPVMNGIEVFAGNTGYGLRASDAQIYVHTGSTPSGANVDGDCVGCL